MAYSATYTVTIKAPQAFHFPLVLSIFKSTVVKNYDGAMQNAKAKLEAGV